MQTHRRSRVRLPLDRVYETVRDAIRLGNLKTAKRILKGCVLRNRHDGQAWELFGIAHYHGGNYPLVVSALKRAKAYITLSSASQAYLAHAYAMTGQVESARQMLSVLVEREDLSHQLLLQIGITLDAIGSTGLSIVACRKALQKSPNNAQVYYDLSYYADRMGYPNTTIERLARRAIKCDPTNTKYRIGLAIRLAMEDRFSEAHALILNLGMMDISSMSCAASVKSIIDVFSHANDQRRLAVCRQRLVELRLRGCGFNCAR